MRELSFVKMKTLTLMFYFEGIILLLNECEKKKQLNKR